ncbi:MAG TPA: EAL domain-containing protein [Hyphomonadaceae bacterium]|nr:EAL domain-containing protein [Hyphomonadaceae bacterium]HPI49625.1 EAL domain-containing protein [Hyphomonadaceae bacterium]
MPVIAHIMLALVYITASVVGAVALYVNGFVPSITAGIIGATSALAMIQLHMAISRAGGGSVSEKDLFEIKQELRKITSRVAQNEQHAAELKSSFERDIAQRRETILNEMRGLEGMIQNLSKKFETRLQSVRAAPAEAPMDGASVLDAVKEALRENRVDLHLQAIVNLPQRRTCFYEGFTRLRRANGQIIMPAEFLGAAERANLLGVIDNMLLFRCVQIVRRLSERDRRIGVFCNISMASLEDEMFFPPFLEFMRENRDLAHAMIFELGVRQFNQRSDIAMKNMSKLKELGFRFSLDKGDGLNFDLPQLQAAGVKFVKVNVERLLEELTPGGERPISSITRDIAAEDVPAVFVRYGIDLIAEKMETEKSVIEVLEFEIPFGQGHVFGAPRPIKGTLQDETAPPPDFVRRVSQAAM